MSDPVTLDFSKAQPISAPSGGVTLDFSKAQPIGTQGPDLETVVKKSFSGQPLTPDEQQLATQQIHANTQTLADQYAKSGQMTLGGGGVQNVAAGDGPSVLRWLYNNPKVKPIIDAAIEDTAHIPGNKTLKAAWNSFGQPVKQFLSKGAGGGVQEVEGTEGAAQNAAGELTPPNTQQPASPAPPALTEAAPVPDTPSTASAEPVPPSMRTLSGESALRKVLTGQDNANLLKIAKSRGINVTKEALLKPGTADNLIINKIVDDFAPEELDELGARYLENTRMGKHDFGDVGPEAWKTMSLQSYFPDLRIPQAVLNRTAKAVSATAVNSQDLSPLWTEALQRVKAAQAAKGQ